MNNSTETEGFPSGVQALKTEILSSLHCVLPGMVEAFDPETGTAVVRPALKRNRRNGGPCEMPLLRDVPVFMPVPFEVNLGDACLLVFADCDIDAWFASREAAVPASSRMHSLSDAFAFVGFKIKGGSMRVEGGGMKEELEGRRVDVIKRSVIGTSQRSRCHPDRSGGISSGDLNLPAIGTS